MDESGNDSNRWRLLQPLNEFAISLNIVSAVAYGLLLYLLKELGKWAPKDDADYYFLRAAARVDDYLHFRLVNPVTTHALARQEQSRWAFVGEDLTIFFSILSAVVIVWLLLRATNGTLIHRFIVNIIYLPSLLFAPAIGYLSVSKATSGWAIDPGSSGASLAPSWIFRVFAGEVLSLVILWLIRRRDFISVVSAAILLGLHYVFWTLILWNELSIDYLPIHAKFLAVAFPISGAIWLLYFRAMKLKVARVKPRMKVGKWLLVGGFAGSVVLLAIWIPARGYSLTHPENIGSLTVEIARGSCYGSCPVYTIIIHGDGTAEYVGLQNVRVKGRQTAILRDEQVAELFRELDQVHFFAIEDRAFRWCFDTPSVSVSVSAGGKTKRVTSDDCGGSKTGVQARFVNMTRQVDNIVGSDRWVGCGRRPCIPDWANNP